MSGIFSLRTCWIGLFTISSCCTSTAIVASPASADEAPRPNILVILADDLGYSDVGCYGGEIRTPNLDSLARGGLQFTQFYNTGRCWPTRAALLTGYYAQQVRRDAVEGVSSGGKGNRPDWAPLLSARLSPLGYRTYHSGKWHIDGMPVKEGFDRSYYVGDQQRFFSPKIHFLDDQKLPPVERDSGYYATVAIADHAIECLSDHDAQYPDQPFFHYLAFTAPHFPLHALQEDIDRYRDMYRRDWEQVREERWQRVQHSGLVNGELSAVERAVGPPYDFPEAIEKLGPGEVNRPLPWSDLTEEQREFQATKMAIHAAMIDRMDREIGRVLEQLRKMDAMEDTLIVFLSDNGASAEIMIRADGHEPDAAPGSAASHLCLGPGWSTTSNTPFRRHKTWVHEGGIATPMIVHWPAGIADRGSLRHTPGHVIDLVPTMLELVGQRTSGDGAPCEGEDCPPLPGASLLSVFERDGNLTRDTLWWLHEGNRAIRVGDWKLVAAKDQPWELFNLGEDRAETQDLAASHPEMAGQLEQQWNERHEEYSRHAKAGVERDEASGK